MNIIQWATGRGHGVEKLRVSIEEESEAIDLLTERLDFLESVKLDNRDLEYAFQQRLSLVRRAFDQRLDALRVLYGTTT